MVDEKGAPPVQIESSCPGKRSVDYGGKHNANLQSTGNAVAFWHFFAETPTRYRHGKSFPNSTQWNTGSGWLGSYSLHLFLDSFFPPGLLGLKISGPLMSTSKTPETLGLLTCRRAAKAAHDQKRAPLAPPKKRCM